MLRELLKSFLSGLTEREFDAPLMDGMAAQGFFDIHFIHGAFEFGKDVIAKRRDATTGAIWQYAIQSKAGDIGQSEWRDVRQQLQESIYNPNAHPSFDVNLPRQVVLATTGRLKGAAPVDAQAFGAWVETNTGSVFSVWDSETFIDWFSSDPAVAIGATAANEFNAFIFAIREHRIREPDLERLTRRWCVQGTSSPLASQAIEAAVLSHEFRTSGRLDLAALTALHLLRGAWTANPVDAGQITRPPLADASLRLFGAYTDQLLGEVEPFLADPARLAWVLADGASMVTYPATLTTLAELFGVTGLFEDSDHVVPGLRERARRATLELITSHPGAARPISDRFATALIAPTVVALQTDRSQAVAYLRKIASWLIERHATGLGLASLDESDEDAAERLLGAALDSTKLDQRLSSYAFCVINDLLLVSEDADLYSAVQRNVNALKVIPSAMIADESDAAWKRRGPAVWPAPRIEYSQAWSSEGFSSLVNHPEMPHVDCIALSSVTRSRHDASCIATLVRDASPEVDR